MMKAFLVATAHNQAPHFLEWVAHHLELGFTDIAIYQNDSDDLTHETLSALRDIGAIQYFYNRAPKPIRRQSAHARAAKLAAYNNSDLVMALEVDEFLVVKAGNGTLNDLVASMPDGDCIGIRRRNFGNSGYEILTEQLATERFSMAGSFENTNVIKYLHSPANTQQSLPSDQITPTTLAQINHYATRDIASFLLKSAQRPPAAVARYWNLRNTNVEIDNSTRPFLARVAARMDALDDASDGQLMDLREAAIFAHLARYYTALQDAPTRQLRRFCKGQTADPQLAATAAGPKPAIPKGPRRRRSPEKAVEKAAT